MRLVLHCFSLFLSLLANSRALNNSLACGIPGKPYGGQVVQHGKTTSGNAEIVNYSCRETDYLVGSVNRTCGPDSKWTGSVPVCLSPTSFNENLHYQVTTTGDEHVYIYDPCPGYFDHNPWTCCKPYDTIKPAIFILLDSTRILEGIRVVFPTQRNNDHRFAVYSHNFAMIRTQCDQLGSGEFRQIAGTQFTFGCSIKNGASRWLSLIFGESIFGICEIFLFFQSDDKKCDSPDAPLHGKSYQMSPESFNFHCDTGYELSGSNYTTCAPNRTWNQETPSCIKKIEDNRNLYEKGNCTLYDKGNCNDSLLKTEENHFTPFVHGVVTGVLGIIVIEGIVVALYLAYRRRSEKRPNHSSQRSNSSNASLCLRYSGGPVIRNAECPEEEERPRNDTSAIFDYEYVNSTGTARAMDTPSLRPGSTISHIYAVPVDDALEYDVPNNEDRNRKSNFVMTDNDYYSMDT